MAQILKVAALVSAINVAVVFGAIASYYAYGKLTYPNYFCGSFGMIDPQIGWVIAPNASSCIGGREAFSVGAPWFEGKVFSDSNGFRSEVTGTPTPTNGIMAVGDSWTFGYGVNFADSFPGKLQILSGVPVVVAASPAYGAAQAIMLAERWIDRLAPRAIIYLDLGLWDRSACTGAVRPEAILKPCYWQAPGTKTATLVVPPSGRVMRFASWGVLPGGMLGAGEDSWTYFLISRPVSLGYQLLARAGVVPGFGHDFAAVSVDPAAIQRGVLDHLVHLARRASVPVLLIDGGDIYSEHFAALSADRKINLYRVGRDVWLHEVDEPSNKLPAEVARVPHDGHFGPGMNALVASMLWKQLSALGVALPNPATPHLKTGQ